jgi:hypothetical protein
MKKLFHQIYIENFSTIQQELLDLITPDKIESAAHTMTSWILEKNYVLKKCPTLELFLKTHSKAPLSQIKFYLSPPKQGIGCHIDGYDYESAQPFGLVLPLKNADNTFVNWYESDQITKIDLDPSEHFKSLYTQALVAPKESLRLIDKVEVTSPMFTRSNILHDVTNNNDSIRYTAVLRWPIYCKDIDQVVMSNKLGQ